MWCELKIMKILVNNNRIENKQKSKKQNYRTRVYEVWCVYWSEDLESFVVQQNKVNKEK